jgi:hypothetical protein
MKTRPRYITLSEAEAGMELAAPLSTISHGILNLTLPAGHILTHNSLQQLHAHKAEFMFIVEPESRPSEQIAIEAAEAAHRVMEIFAGADLSDPAMATLFNQILIFHSK